MERVYTQNLIYFHLVDHQIICTRKKNTGLVTAKECTCVGSACIQTQSLRRLMMFESKGLAFRVIVNMLTVHYGGFLFLEIFIHAHTVLIIIAGFGGCFNYYFILPQSPHNSISASSIDFSPCQSRHCSNHHGTQLPWLLPAPGTVAGQTLGRDIIPNVLLPFVWEVLVLSVFADIIVPS